MMVVVTTPAIMVMMVVTAPAIMVMMVMTTPAIMMMVVMILHQRHIRIGAGFLGGPRSLGSVHGSKHREGIRDRLEQFGVGLCLGQPRRIRGLKGGGLGAVERRQA
jgi:hypothetical protein